MLNLPSNVQKALIHGITVSRDFSPKLFDDALAVITDLIEKDVFRRFLHSSECREMVHFSLETCRPVEDRF